MLSISLPGIAGISPSGRARPFQRARVVDTLSRSIRAAMHIMQGDSVSLYFRFRNHSPSGSVGECFSNECNILIGDPWPTYCFYGRGP